jgi:peptidoglycan/xylan/chitin deacetylase (PgdA/CDA1 family)
MLSSVKQLAKAAIQQGVFNGHTAGLLRTDWQSRARASILAYHSVCPTDDPYLPYIGHNLSIEPQTFERQVAYLARYYRIVDLTTLARYLSEGYDDDRPLLALTFDDGYRDNYRYAFPILRRYRAPATFFLTTDCIDGGSPLWALEAAYIVLNSTRQELVVQPIDLTLDLRTPEARRASLRSLKLALSGLPRAERTLWLAELRRAGGIADDGFFDDAMLRWHQVEEMRDAGMAFGSHTRSHPSLPYVPRQEAEDEIVGSKRVLERTLGEPVLHFCYPNPAGRPNFNDELSALLRANGFKTSVTSQSGYVNMGESLFSMHRIGIYRSHSRLPAFYFRLNDRALARPSVAASMPVGSAVRRPEEYS